MALTEIRNILQEEKYNKRWFQDDYFDLMVWYDSSDIAGFELCYDRIANEHVFMWWKDSGAAHYAVDSGSDTPLKNMTPLYVSDGSVDARALLARFSESAQAIEPALSEFVSLKIQELLHKK